MRLFVGDEWCIVVSMFHDVLWCHCLCVVDTGRAGRVMHYGSIMLGTGGNCCLKMHLHVVSIHVYIESEFELVTISVHTEVDTNALRSSL